MLATIIFIVTLVFVIWQPRGLGIGTSALIGALVALVLGVVKLDDVAVVWDIVWDATLTFVALIVISLILDEAGFFAWAARHVIRLGGGHGARLLPLIVLLGAFISAFFANDGAALLLTPIVIVILKRMAFPAAAALGLIMATGFIADTASLPFSISNLVNMVSANYFDVSFARYAMVMLPVNLVSVAASLVVLWVVYRRVMPSHYETQNLESPQSAVTDHLVFHAAFPVLLVLMVAWFVLGAYGVPVSVVTGSGALVLMAIAGRWWKGGQGSVIAVSSVLRQAPWQIVLFSVGMYLVVYGVGQAGLTQYGAQTLEWLSQQGPWVATVGTGFLSAVLASIVNNMPSTLIGVLSIAQAQTDPMIRELMVYANVIGNDLGPKLTPIGSLATLLWLHVLAGKGFRVSWGQYLKVGLLLTPPVLLVTLLALAWWLPWVGGL